MTSGKSLRLAWMALLALVVSGIFVGSASASPVWKFNGTELTGSETIVGAAVSSSLSIPGLTTTCEHFLYNVSISNSAGTGKGSVNEVPLFECHTNSAFCTVESIAAEKLPWPSHLATVAGKNYLIIEGIRVNVIYGGEECAFSEIMVPVTGTAGGLLDNTTETATFNAASFSATGTSLKFGTNKVEWNGLFPTEAFAWHRTQSLSVG